MATTTFTDIKKYVVLSVFLVAGCSLGDIGGQKVSYFDASGTPRDSLGRNATFAGKPLCSNVTLKGDSTECRVR